MKELQISIKTPLFSQTVEKNNHILLKNRDINGLRIEYYMNLASTPISFSCDTKVVALSNDIASNGNTYGNSFFVN